MSRLFSVGISSIISGAPLSVTLDGKDIMKIRPSHQLLALSFSGHFPDDPCLPEYSVGSGAIKGGKRNP